MFLHLRGLVRQCLVQRVAAQSVPEELSSEASELDIAILPKVLSFSH
jgi:hypothetical protein